MFVYHREELYVDYAELSGVYKRLIGKRCKISLFKDAVLHIYIRGVVKVSKGSKIRDRYIINVKSESILSLFYGCKKRK